MIRQGEPGALVIGIGIGGTRGQRQPNLGFVYSSACQKIGMPFAAGDGPEGTMAVAGQPFQRTGRGEFFFLIAIEPGAVDQILHISKWPNTARGNDTFSAILT